MRKVEMIFLVTWEIQLVGQTSSSPTPISPTPTANTNTPGINIIVSTPKGGTQNRLRSEREMEAKKTAWENVTRWMLALELSGIKVVSMIKVVISLLLAGVMVESTEVVILLGMMVNVSLNETIVTTNNTPKSRWKMKDRIKL
jgi:hypothetical protein